MGSCLFIICTCSSSSSVGLYILYCGALARSLKVLWLGLGGPRPAAQYLGDFALRIKYLRAKYYFFFRVHWWPMLFERKTNFRYTAGSGDVLT